MSVPVIFRNFLPCRRWVPALLSGGVVLLIGVGGIWFGLNLAPVHPGENTKQRVEIAYGSNTAQIARLLFRRRLIRSEAVFRLWTRLTGRERALKAGIYLLSPAMSTPKILTHLCKGEEALIRVTIPEGATLVQIAAILAKQGLTDTETFLRLVRDPVLMAEVAPEAQGSLEGFLFPDTYYLSPRAEAEGAIRVMAARFREIFTPAMRARAQALGYTPREIVILASLVEGEAKREEERPLVAAVFHNRLQRGMPLQSCATVQYALGKHKERLLYKDLQVASPYNTYLHPGLPPGPIGSPGLASIRAALYPARVDYLYFVARPDGGHIFSSTYAEHLRAQKITRGQVSGR